MRFLLLIVFSAIGGFFLTIALNPADWMRAIERAIAGNGFDRITNILGGANFWILYAVTFLALFFTLIGLRIAFGSRKRSKD